MQASIRKPSLADRPPLRCDWAESLAAIGAVAILSESYLAMPMDEDLAGAQPIGRGTHHPDGKVLSDAELTLLLADVRQCRAASRLRSDCA